MASNQLDTSDEFSVTVFGVRLPTLSPYAQEVYDNLLYNGLCVFQPNCRMDIGIIKAALGCYYPIVRSIYLQSPQVAWLDISIGREVLSPVFHRFFYQGIHRASFSDNPVMDCNVVFSPLSESLQAEHLHMFAVAIAEQKSLPGMNLDYFYRNPEWNHLARPKLLDLPSGDDLDLFGQQL